MKLSGKLGFIGFAIGLVAPLVFYASPASFFTYQSHFVCPWCPYLDIAFANTLTWVGVGLRIGLISGLLLALIGFGIGYAVARVPHAT